MDILNKSIGHFDPNAKIGEMFVVDIEFDAYDHPRQKNVQWGVSLYLWAKEQGPCGQSYLSVTLDYEDWKNGKHTKEQSFRKNASHPSS